MAAMIWKPHTKDRVKDEAGVEWLVVEDNPLPVTGGIGLTRSRQPL